MTDRVSRPPIGDTTSHLDKAWKEQITRAVNNLAASGSSGVADGDKGDVIVSGGGTTWTIDPAVTGSFALASHTHTVSQITDLFEGRATLTLPNTSPNFGVYEHEEVIAVVGITSSHRILVSLAPHLDSDENAEDFIDLEMLMGIAGTNQITFKAYFSTPTSGSLKVEYLGV